MNGKTVKKILAATPVVYDKLSGQFFQTRKKPWPVFSLLENYIKDAHNIIDFGCGSGRVAELVAANQNYFGLDNSRELIELARTDYSNKKNILFQVASIIDFQPPREKYDLALLIASLHHIPTAKLQLRVLQNICDSLSPDSILFMTNWNLWQKNYRRHLFDYRTKLFKYKLVSLSDAIIPWKIKNDWQYRYVHSFPRRELKRLLKQAGFETTEIYYEADGKKTNIWRGRNLVAIAKKK